MSFGIEMSFGRIFRIRTRNRVVSQPEILYRDPKISCRVFCITTRNFGVTIQNFESLIVCCVFRISPPNFAFYMYGPFHGKWNFNWFQGKKSASLLDHISRFLSHQFVTWYLRSISKTKIVKLFCPCMSEHMIFIKNVTNVTQALHQNVANVTKQNIASKEILMIEFHTKYMKLLVNMLSVICVLLNTKFYNTSENFYFEVIWSRTIVSCKVTNVTNRHMDFILDLDEEFYFQRPVCLDSNRKHYYQSKTCW